MSHSVSESPLGFEITRVDCIAYIGYKLYKRDPEESQLTYFNLYFLALQTWDQIRPHIVMTDARGGLPGRLRRLQDNMADFISDTRNRHVVQRVDYLLQGVTTDIMENISLAVVPLLEVVRCFFESALKAITDDRRFCQNNSSPQNISPYITY